ncbi:hypothetical protein D3C77_783170 [compost metagenome]
MNLDATLRQPLFNLGIIDVELHHRRGPQPGNQQGDFLPLVQRHIIEHKVEHGASHRGRRLDR